MNCLFLINHIYFDDVLLYICLCYILWFRKVLKEISVGELQPDETVDAVREARVLSKLDHPSIVKFHDSFIDGESFCIVTEFCEVII